MSTTVLAVCPACRHYSGRRSCDAFGRIPDAVWSGENDHAAPIAGDHGLRFEPSSNPSGKGSDEGAGSGR